VTCVGEKALLRLAIAGDKSTQGILQLLPSTLRYVQEHLGEGTSLYHGKSSLPRQQDELIGESFDINELPSDELNDYDMISPRDSARLKIHTLKCGKKKAIKQKCDWKVT